MIRAKINRLIQIEIPNLKTTLGRIAPNRKRTMCRVQESIATEFRPTDSGIRDRDIQWQISRPPKNACPNRMERGIFKCRGRAEPGLQIVCPEIVLAQRRSHRSNQSDIVHTRRRFRQALAQPYPWNRGRNRTQWPSRLNRRQRLGIERLEMARATVKPNQNA